MCTVTFIPLDGKVVITSNRDEALSRPLAWAPAPAEINGKKLLFPKDPQAGGTWFAACENGTVCALLNGAFTRHIRVGNYRKSRGLVLLDIISSDNAFVELNNYDCKGIEPFTLLAYHKWGLTEFRWDGQSRYFKDLDKRLPHIYSSATLYDPEIIHQREKWFEEFLNKGEEKTPESIIAFHSSAGRGDSQNGLVMSRGEFLKTQSITQAVVLPSEIDLYYRDLIRGTETHSVLPVSSKRLISD